MGTIQVDEAQHAALVEKAGRVSTLESERDTAIQERDAEKARADAAEVKIAESDRATTVARVLGEAAEAASVKLNQFERDGIAARAVRAEDGSVDEAKTREAFDKAIATLAEAHGVGRPRGLGGPVRTAVEGSADDLDAELDRLSESAFGPIDTVKEA